MIVIVLFTALLALAFSFTNGMNDAANCIASAVATKALSPKVAVAWSAFWILSALFFFDLTVASTMGSGIVSESCIDVFVILAALLGSVFWVFTCSMVGLPISASHALIGGLIGPVWFVYGSDYLVSDGIIKTLAFIVIAPLIGMVMGFTLNCLFLFICRRFKARRVDKVFRVLQVISCAEFSMGFGANDGQKTMGIIAVLLSSAFAADPENGILRFLYGDAWQASVAAGHTGFFVPLWLELVCYGLIALGTVTGGWKVIRTLGDGLSKLTPMQGFCAEGSGAATLILTALFGIPVSTTHTITGSIIGTGLTRGVKRVKWMTAKNIVWAWVLTIPAVVVISGLIYLAMVNWFGVPVKVF